ncbi:TonB-dependent receptor [Pedobacter petrophilus]|uniref:TonB-dependent receptor n=1 Tax=Pedobacter petrophilus TaxID=1908241 RepID=A0A7K0FUK7_9SPHI|nr:TonB-dependent receptor [Pedobacter petrophilus]MRX75275.1 TonB-dependent receptor [Pedobacter petrophilus]
MKKRLLSVLFVLFMLSITSFAQIIVKGKVVTAKGEGLIGASIKEKGSNKGTSSDLNGDFQISVSNNAILIVSAVGYAPKEVQANSSQLTITLTESAENLTDLVVVGTRGKARSSILTPVPVDVIRINQVNMPTAKMDLTSILNSASPSFNFNKQSGSDGADQIDLATLRGLGPDQTLVLVNGKRRHQTAFVAVFGTRGRGNSGTDLNAIPESSIDRVEILRDGASAQYGSDAIAGVINLILKKDVGTLSFNTGYSGYYDPKFNTHYGKELGQYRHSGAIDGNALSVGANYGVALGKNNGFINFSGNFFKNGKTFRQNLNTDLSTKDGLPINTVRRSTGDGSVTSGGLMYNMEIPIANTKTIIYSFGGGNAKSSEAYAYTRNFSERPERFPDGVIGNPILQTTIDGETYFDPIIQTKIQDISFAAGIKGIWGKDWNWDLSNTLGRNNFHFYGDQTFNASLGAGKTHFDDGGFSFLQNTVNFNLSKVIPTVASGLNLAFGLEHRYEAYEIFAGEPDSYANYNADKATGAQGFPGYQPADEVNANRSNVAAYVDAELDATDKWLLGVAVRAENYSDFGFTSNYKFATRYKLTNNFNVRGSLSTGFRAPSLQQINFSNTFTNVQGGNVFEVKIAPNYSPITKAAGIPDLKQEKSVNASLGFSWKPVSNVTVTLDGYRINIKDRVVLSGQFDESIPALKPILNQLNVTQAQFFANAVNTTNYGLDLVVDYNKKFDNKSIRVLFTGNLNRLNIDQINIPSVLSGSYENQQAFFSDREQAYIKASAPPVKLGLNLDYGFGNWMVGTHFLYYGKISILGYGYENTYPPLVALDNDPNTTVLEQFNYSGKMVSDLYGSYKFSKRVTVFFGADNVFNVHPDLGYVQGAKLSAYDGETGGAWDAVQMGFNGRRLFTKLAFNF